jgi:lipopolysaccharide export system protein LptA
MRTTEAARYARWSAGIALLLSLVVAGVYGARDWQSRKARRKVPAAVPSSVEQRSAGFTFSKVVGNRTEFTVRASHATEFAQGGRSLLEDVWITAYGGAGERYDNLHTRTCDYLTPSESISCAGDVQIELDRASDHERGENTTDASDSKLVHVATSHVFFDHKTGLATTDRPVSFRFSQGEGKGVGFRYETQQGEMQLLGAVELALHEAYAPDQEPQATTRMLHLSGSSMSFDRDQRIIHLEGPVHAQEANFTLVCGKLDIELDEHMYAHRLIATEEPMLQSTDDMPVTLQAEKITALASPSRIESIVAEGNVHATSEGQSARDDLQADNVETQLDPESNQPRQLDARGSVRLREERKGSVRNLETSLLHLDFARTKKGGQAQLKHAVTPAGKLEIQDSTIVSGKTTHERISLAAKRFEAEFTGNNDLRELDAEDGVHFERQIGTLPPQTTTSQQMVTRFEPGGEWSTVDQNGNVQLQQENGNAQAEHAHFDRGSDSTLLEGAVVVTDATSRTTARTAIFNQQSNEFHAFGRVATIENSNGESQFVNFATGPSRVSGDRLDGNSGNGHAVYSGNARLWQGDSIVEGDKIELDRKDHTLTATGRVRAIFPEAVATNGGAQESHGESRTAPQRTEFWHAQGNRLIYWSDESRGRMEQSVRTYSDEGSMSADAMEYFFAPTAKSGPAKAEDRTIGPTGTDSGKTQQLIRASAFGNVKVEQQGRHGTANRADYTAQDRRFVLSGGAPTVYDALGNATKGRQLTFFFGDDSINIDSAEGLRTLTLHRVEK